MPVFSSAGYDIQGYVNNDMDQAFRFFFETPFDNTNVVVVANNVAPGTADVRDYTLPVTAPADRTVQVRFIHSSPFIDNNGIPAVDVRRRGSNEGTFGATAFQEGSDYQELPVAANGYSLEAFRTDNGQTINIGALGNAVQLPTAGGLYAVVAVGNDAATVVVIEESVRADNQTTPPPTPDKAASSVHVSTTLIMTALASLLYLLH